MVNVEAESETGGQDRRDVSLSRRLWRWQVFLKMVNCYTATGRWKPGNSQANLWSGREGCCVLSGQETMSGGHRQTESKPGGRSKNIAGESHIPCRQSAVKWEAPCSLNTGWLMSGDELQVEIIRCGRSDVEVWQWGAGANRAECDRYQYIGKWVGVHQYQWPILICCVLLILHCLHLLSYAWLQVLRSPWMKITFLTLFICHVYNNTHNFKYENWYWPRISISLHPYFLPMQ